MIQLLIIIYLAFISLGLPDSLLGSAWPSMYPTMQVPVSYAGIIAMIIAAGTIISSLQSDLLTCKLGTAKVTVISVGMTALALFGFSVSSSFPILCAWSVLYGLGAGSVDAALNNYVALHYSSRHMSWLHCMWGVGASLGPFIMGYALTGGQSWNMGYRCIALLQVFLTFILLLSLPLWKKQYARANLQDKETNRAPLSLKLLLRIPGAKETMITFFCYCALEQTAILWGSSYLVLNNGISAQDAAKLAGLFFLGITPGRAASGFLTMALDDTRMVRLGLLVIFTGICTLLLPGGNIMAKAGLVLIGLGCAPIYPSLLHATPNRFGPDKSQAVIGIQMASAYVGTCLMPPFFGLLAQRISISLLPVYLLLILMLMIVMHEKIVVKTRRRI